MKRGWKKNLLYASLIIFGGVLLFIFGETVRLKNTGFETKTLWDWMHLLIIPVVLAVGAFFLERSERADERKTSEARAKLEREISTDRQQEAALQAYLDRMAELMLEKDLRTTQNEEMRNVARIRTLTVLRGLDEIRKAIVLVFLYESGLIIGEPVVDLTEADLSGANLSGTDLSKAMLSNANFSNANLSKAQLAEANLKGAMLSGADLSYAKLSGANLSEANLYQASLIEADLSQAQLTLADLRATKLSAANLREADLRGADLAGANLTALVVSPAGAKYIRTTYGSEADLTGADLTGANLTEADIGDANLTGATMPDGTKHD
jgi:uncharacterized protein YjbI with pentapeptide repeats